MRWLLVCLALAGCDHGKSPCAGEQTDNLETPNSDAALQFQIDKCRADTTACHDLCAIMLLRTHPSGAMQTGCNVTFHVDHVEVKYKYGCTEVGGPDAGFGMIDAPGFFVDASMTSPLDAP